MSFDTDWHYAKLIMNNVSAKGKKLSNEEQPITKKMAEQYAANTSSLIVKPSPMSKIEAVAILNQCIGFLEALASNSEGYGGKHTEYARKITSVNDALIHGDLSE